MARFAWVTAAFCVAASTAAAQTSTTALARHVDAAQKAQARQDCGTAAKEYAAAVRLLPSSGELMTNEGIALYCSNHFSEAIGILQQALAVKPELAVPHLFIGLAAFHLANMPLAIRELENARQTMQRDITANLWLGYAYLADHREQSAIAQFNTVLGLQPANVDAGYAIGEAYFELGRSKARELERTAPHGRGIGLLVAAELASQKGTGPEGESTLPAAWQSPREEQLYQEASEDENSAKAALQRVLDEAPDSDRAHQIAGDALSLQRKNEAAIREYRLAIQRNAALPGIRLALANCLMQTDQFDAALSVLSEEQALQPRSAEVWMSTGRVQLAMGRDTDAARSLQRSLALPDHPQTAALLMGKVLLRLGDAKAAVPLLEQALRDGADAATANYLLARAYRSTGDKESMQRALDAYHRLSQDEAERQSAMAVTADPGMTGNGIIEKEILQETAVPTPNEQ